MFIAHFGVGYCSRGIMRGCIAIPVQDEDGALVAYAGRRLKASDIKEYGKYKLPKGFRKEFVLYNYHRAASVMAPSVSGSSHSPSPRKAHNFGSSVHFTRLRAWR